MNIFKSSITIIACVGFLVFAFMMGGNIHSERIKADMVKCSILEYRSGASTYLAEKDSKSKVLFGNLSGNEVFGVGAFTETENGCAMSSGLTLYTSSNKFELPNASDILSASISPDNRYIAIIDIEGHLIIFDIASGNATFNTANNESVLISNPFDSKSLVKPPFSCWSYDKLILTMITSEDIVWGVTTKAHYSLLAIDPTNGNSEAICESSFSSDIVTVFGTISKSHILVHATPSNLTSTKPSSLYSVDIKNNKINYQGKYIGSIIGFSERNSRLYLMEGKDIVSLHVSSNLISNPDSTIKLPTIADKQLIASDLTDIRLTSRGFIFAKQPGSSKNILIDPRSCNYILLDANEVPY